MSFTSPLLADIPGIRHAFLNAAESAACPVEQRVDIKQVHGTDILHLTQRPDDRPHVDGIFTTLTDRRVGIVTADCLPLLMSARDGRAVCSVHAGWRGAAEGIIANSVALFARHGVAARDIVVAIGPHIRSCCYEVSADFYPALLKTPGGVIAARHRQTLFSDQPRQRNALSAPAQQPDGQWFNLPAFCHQLLLAEGIAPEHIDLLPVCTYCTPRTLGSFRRRTHSPAPKTQQYSWIART